MKKKTKKRFQLNKAVGYQLFFTLLVVGVVVLIFVLDPFSAEDDDVDFSSKIAMDKIKIDQVSSIKIETSEASILLELEDEKWMARSKDKESEEYSEAVEADKSKIDTIITTAGGAKLDDQLSNNSDNHSKFEVDDEKGTIVKFLKGEDIIEEFVVGKFAAGGGTYIREIDGDAVYKLNANIVVFKDSELSYWEKTEADQPIE